MRIPKLSPRFSLRTLLVLVTLVCVYFGCWEITKRYGVPAVDSMDNGILVSSPMPFVVGCYRLYDKYYGRHDKWEFRREHYLWIFGFSVRTPFSWVIGDDGDNLPIVKGGII